MANTGNTQQIIDYGTTANDGTGDPLRTAFIKTDENFNNIWLAGPVGSNITISNNTIQNDSTNGNIILKPNGIGVIQANAAIVPSAANVRDIGTANVPFRAGYFGVGGITVSGDATVGGNLRVEGDIVEVGNIVTDALTIQLANTAGTDAAANGAGVTVGANDDIATLLYNSTNNEWRTNIGLNVAGNLSIDGTFAVDSIQAAGGLYGQFGAFTGLNGRGIDALVAGVSGGTFLGTDVIIQVTGNSNAYTQFNFQNISTGTQASTDYVITANNGDDETYFLNIGLTNSGWDGSQDNSLGNLLGANDGYFYVQDGNLVIGTKEAGNTHVHTWKWDTTGNVTATGNLIPSANLTYSLGNSTNWWSNIWVASNTIYIGGVALGVTGNVLTVDGEPVLSNDSNSSITTTGDISAGNINATGNIVADGTVQGNVVTADSAINTAGTIGATGNVEGGNIISDGEIVSNGRAYVQYVDIRGGYSSGTIGSIGYGGNIVELQGTAGVNIVTTGDEGGPSWQFGTDGRLTVPDGAFIQVVDTNYLDIAYVGNIQLENEGGAWNFDFNGDLTAPGNITASNIVTNGISSDDSTFVTIRDGLNVDGDIEAAGNIVLSGGSVIQGLNNGLYITPNPNSLDDFIQISSFTGQEGVVVGTTGGIILQSDAGNKSWNFGTNGTLLAPGAISSSGNVSAPNFLGNIAAANVVGTVSAATTAGTVTSNAQANITSVGTLSSLSVSGNIATGNILTDGYFYANGDPFVSSNYGDSNVVTLLGSFGSNTVSTTGNVSGGNIIAATEVTVDALSITNSSIDAVTQFTISTSNTATGNSSSILMDRNGVGVVVQLQDTGGGPYSWGLYQDNILFPDGSRQYSAYGNANVVANLAALGSNPISTTGNITAANFIGNVSLTGNITGTSANVELVAGSYTFTFDNTGVATFPAIGGDEGGEIHLGVPAANTTLQNTVKIDVYQDRIRFFEGSANAKGAYIDLANCANGVDTAIGYLNIPQITLSANTTAALADSGKHFYSTTAGDLAILIPTNANVAFPTGTAFTVVVQAAGNVLVNADTGVTLYMAGSSSAGNRTVGAYGMATVMKVASDTWFINGTGVY